MSKILILIPFLLFVTDTALVQTCVQPVRFGKAETRLFPAVVQIRAPRLRCTGVLTGPREATTARHCIPEKAVGVRVVFEGRGAVAVEAVRRHPTEDAAVLVLAEEGLAEPMVLAESVPPGWHTLAFAGYGCAGMCFTEDGPMTYGTGTKRWASFSAEGFGAEYRSESWWICSGDSGGPVIDLNTGEVVAIGVGFWHVGRGENTRFLRMIFVLAETLGEV